MKKIIVIAILALMTGATICGTVYIHDSARVRLAGIDLDKAKLEAQADIQRLIARAYLSAFRIAGIVVGICVITGLIVGYLAFRRMADGVTDLARLSMTVTPIPGARLPAPKPNPEQIGYRNCDQYQVIGITQGGPV